MNLDKHRKAKASNDYRECDRQDKERVLGKTHQAVFVECEPSVVESTDGVKGAVPDGVSPVVAIVKAKSEA